MISFVWFSLQFLFSMLLYERMLFLSLFGLGLWSGVVCLLMNERRLFRFVLMKHYGRSGQIYLTFWWVSSILQLEATIRHCFPLTSFLIISALFHWLKQVQSAFVLPCLNNQGFRLNHLPFDKWWLFSLIMGLSELKELQAIQVYSVLMIFRYHFRLLISMAGQQAQYKLWHFIEKKAVCMLPKCKWHHLSYCRKIQPLGLF